MCFSNSFYFCKYIALQIYEHCTHAILKTAMHFKQLAFYFSHCSSYLGNSYYYVLEIFVGLSV